MKRASIKDSAASQIECNIVATIEILKRVVVSFQMAYNGLAAFSDGPSQSYTNSYLS